MCFIVKINKQGKTCKAVRAGKNLKHKMKDLKHLLVIMFRNNYVFNRESDRTSYSYDETKWKKGSSHISNEQDTNLVVRPLKRFSLKVLFLFSYLMFIPAIVIVVKQAPNAKYFLASLKTLFWISSPKNIPFSKI